MRKINFSAQTPRIITSIIIGILFVVFPKFFENFAMYIIGGTITLLGIIKLISYFSRKNDTSRRTLPVGAITTIFIGVIVLMQAVLFTQIMMFSLGFILLIAGASQIMMYLKLKRTLIVPVELYVFPALISIAGLLAVINPFGTIRALVVFFGAILLFYGISELISMAVINKKRE